MEVLEVIFKIARSAFEAVSKMIGYIVNMYILFVFQYARKMMLYFINMYIMFWFSAARKLFRSVFNVYVLFRVLKFLQKRVLDKILDISLGASTLHGWRNERSTRYISPNREKSNKGVVDEKQVAQQNNNTKHASFSENALRQYMAPKEIS